MEINKVLNKIVAENFSRMKYLCLIFAGYAVVVLFVDFAPVGVWNSEYIGIYRILDLIFAVFLIPALIFFWLFKKDSDKIKDYMVKAMLFFVIVWSAIVTSIEVNALGFTTLILLMLISIFFFYINLSTSILFMSGAIIALAITIASQNQVDEDFVSRLFTMIPISTIAVLVSRRNFIGKVNELINSKQLEDINIELEATKLSLEEKVEERTKELSLAKEKAEESNRLKTAFLTNMSHEIRTPMNGILGFAELLKEPGLTGEEQNQYIAIIERSSERMLNIINNLVDISKIEAGQMELSISETNINEQFKYHYDFFEPEANKKGNTISYKTELPSNEGNVYTDLEKFNSILTNLIKNAIKYTENGSIEFGCYSISSITQTSEKPNTAVGERSRTPEMIWSPSITSSNLPVSEVGERSRTHGLIELQSLTDNQVGERSRTPEILFYVKDTGIGIPDDRQEAIFDRFVQADIEDRKAMQGAGLGLSISKAYIEMLGGHIWVESEEGKGSTFYFTIPYRLTPTSDVKNTGDSGSA